MKRYKALAVTVALSVITLAAATGALSTYYKVTPPSSYGTVVMKRNLKGASAAGPALFPHWVHRLYYNCRVCHTELSFPMKAGALDITQSDIENGKFCGRCHNGKEAFGPDKCIRCHSAGIKVKENANIKEALKGFPPDDFGNGVDWARALADGRIKPKDSLEEKARVKILDKDVVIPAVKFSPHPPDVKFPHKTHTKQMDCASCHPEPFKPKKGGNPDMNMMKIISGQYCGKCHGSVSFPLENCFRCHSQPPEVPEWIKEGEKKEEKKKK